MKNVADKNCSENQNTHFCSITFFKKNRAVYEVMWKNIVELGRPQMAHAHYMLVTKGYKCTLMLCSTYCFSTATVVVRTRLRVTL